MDILILALRFVQNVIINALLVRILLLIVYLVKIKLLENRLQDVSVKKGIILMPIKSVFYAMRNVFLVLNYNLLNALPAIQIILLDKTFLLSKNYSL
jgi:hypothetical protein